MALLLYSCSESGVGGGGGNGEGVEVCMHGTWGAGGVGRWGAGGIVGGKVGLWEIGIWWWGEGGGGDALSQDGGVSGFRLTVVPGSRSVG
jgi:hypothetical protein